MIDLPSKLVAENALKAHAEGRLQYQRAPGGSCSYAGGCAIGVSLPPDLATVFDDEDECSVEFLLRAGLITTDDPEFLVDLQKAHDRLSVSPDDETDFLKLLHSKVSPHA